MISVGESDAGKYMVRANNDAGEAQSIADLVISEAMVEPILDAVAPSQVDTVHIDQTRVSSR